MDFMTPPMFDPSNILVWKTRMSIYLQTLGYKVHLAITKDSYLSDSKHIGANAQALEAIRSTLPKEYLILASNFDSAFAVWNMLTTTNTSKLQLPIHYLPPREPPPRRICYNKRSTELLSQTPPHNRGVGP